MISSHSDKVMFGKFLANCGMDRETVDTWFLSPIAAGPLPTRVVGLEEIVFGFGKLTAARKAAAWLAGQPAPGQKRTGTDAPTNRSCERSQQLVSKIAIQKHHNLKD